MNLRTYEDAASFLEVAQAPLEAQEVVHSVILGICLRLRDTPPSLAPFLTTVSDSQGLALAAMMTPPYPLRLAAAGEPAPQALAAVGRALLDGGWSLPGVSGPCALADAFAPLWAEMAGATYRVKMNQRLYRLDRVIPPPQPAAGRLRPATMADLELVARWALGFNVDCFGHGEPADALELATRRLGGGEVYLWEDGGEPVSMAAKARPTRNGVTVNLVYTPPERRGQGYASACVASLSRLVLDSGYRFCTLFTDLANRTSNHIYRQVGYTPVCDFCEYAFGAHSPE